MPQGKQHGKVITIKPEDLSTLKKDVRTPEQITEDINKDIHRKSDATEQLEAEKQPEEIEQEEIEKNITEGVTKKNATLRTESNLFSTAFTILFPATSKLINPSQQNVLDLFQNCLTTDTHLDPTDIMLVKTMVRKM